MCQKINTIRKPFWQMRVHKFITISSKRTLSLNGVKFRLLLEVRLYRQTTEGLDKWNELTLRSKMEPLLTTDEISKSLDRRLQRMETLERFTSEGSGWHHTISTPRCTILTDPRRLLSPTSKRSAKRKAVVNVKNKDDSCLRWALRSAFFPARDRTDPPSK